MVTQRLARLFSVVLVTVDPFGFLVLLLLDGFAVLFGQVAVVLRGHASLFLIDAGFLMLEVAGFAGGELAALDALSDAVLLIFLALVDGWRWGGCSWGLGEDGHRREDQSCCDSEAGEIHL